MSLDLGRVISRTFSITWRHKWLWLLGVFGGTGGGIGFVPRFGFNGGANFGPSTGLPSGGSVSAFLDQYLGLIIGVAVVLVLIAIITTLLGCVAVPASVWAAVAIDGGQAPTLGEAWSQGRRRFWPFLRLVLLRIAIALGFLAIITLLVGLGFLLHQILGHAILPLLILLGTLLGLALLFGWIVVGLGLAWSSRTLVILGVGAVDSIRSSWWLFTRHKLDTIIFGVVMYIVLLGVGLGILAGVVAVSIPGVVLLVAGLVSSGGAVSALVTAGALWVILLGGAVLLVGAGFAGSVAQVGYALACRDLVLGHGMDLAVEAPNPPPPGAPPPG